jgi:hypothetical protein
MDRDSKSSFVLYFFLAIILVGLVILAVSLNQSGSQNNSDNQTKEQQNQDNQTDKDVELESFDLPDELRSAFDEIIKSDQFTFTTSTSFKTVVNNENESSTKNFNFDSTYGFTKTKDLNEVQISFDNREGNSRNKSMFSLVDEILYQVQDTGDLVEIRTTDSEDISTDSIITAIAEIQSYDSFSIPNDAIKKLMISEESNYDVISAELYSEYILDLFSSNSLADLNLILENSSVDLENTIGSVTFYVGVEGIRRVVMIDEISIKSDSTNNFIIKDFASLVEYRILN